MIVSFSLRGTLRSLAEFRMPCPLDFRWVTTIRNCDLLLSVPVKWSGISCRSRSSEVANLPSAEYFANLISIGNGILSIPVKSIAQWRDYFAPSDKEERLAGRGCRLLRTDTLSLWEC